jgi:Zinc finger, C3HC4 type (RING finger)
MIIFFALQKYIDDLLIRMVQALRGSLSHPLIPQEVIESLDEESVAELKQAFCQRPTPEESFPNNIIKMQQKFFGASKNSKPLIGGKFGCTVNFKTYLDTISPPQEVVMSKPEVTCSFCQKPPTDPLTNHCGHVLCGYCARRLLNKAGMKREVAPCPHSRCNMTLEDVGQEVGNTNETLDDLGSTKVGTSTQSVPSSPAWYELGGGVMASTKCLAAKCQILQWLDKDPNGKIIIFIQFVPM